jgi:hypothetical protein
MTGTTDVDFPTSDLIAVVARELGGDWTAHAPGAAPGRIEHTSGGAATVERTGPELRQFQVAWDTGGRRLSSGTVDLDPGHDLSDTALMVCALILAFAVRSVIRPPQP